MKQSKAFKKLLGTILFAAAAFANVSAAEFGTAFTFQGRLGTPDGPAQGPHDFDFSLWDRETDGKLLGTQSRENWPVSNGVFTVELDFGADMFALGQPRWLQIQVKDAASTNDLVTLAPRTPLRPAPYSLLAAGVVDGSVTTDKIADGAVTAAKVAANAITGEKIAPNTVANTALADGAVTTPKLADGGVTSPKLADGAVTSPKLASGAVGSQHIIAGAIGALQLAAGSVNSAKIADGSILGVDIAAGVIGANHLAAGSVGTSQLAAGAVGSAQLASPYQSGAITLGGTFTFAPMAVTQVFSPAFAGTPIVTLAPELAAGDTLSLPNARLASRSVSGFSAQVTAAPLVNPIERGRDYSPMALISPVVLSPALLPQQPAFGAVRRLMDYDWNLGAFVEGDRQLEFWRADEKDGANWSSIVVSTNVDYSVSAAIVAGRPALAFLRESGAYLRPAFVRASDSSGNAWPAETTVNNTATNVYRLRLAVINNKPTIAYADVQADIARLWFVGATDANGTSWGQPRQVPALPQAGFGDFALFSLDGYPACFYHDSEHAALMFARATDTNGANWGSAVIVAANLSATHVSAAVVNGRPAVAYHWASQSKFAYQQANNATGSSFGAPVTLGPDVYLGASSVVLSVVNNRPAALLSCGGLYYTEANDADGMTWRRPLGIGTARDSEVGGFLHIGGGIATVRFDYPWGGETGGTVDYIWSGPGPERLHWTAIQP